MGSLYRSWSMVSALLGLNIALYIFGISLGGNYLYGNHLVDAIMVLGVVSLLADLNLLPRKHQNNLLAIGFIAFIAGGIYELFSFGTFFTMANTLEILTQWIRIAPIIIATIGIPVLMIANQVSREKLIFGFNSTGKNGLIFVSLFSALYTIAAIYVLTKVLGVLVI